METQENTSSKVSIVIPVYKCELYIGACLESLIRQTYNNIEILCVDDCSPDGSREVVQRYAAEDERISIICHKENKGPGGARNTGILCAKGNYICFIDSDDYVSEKYIELLLRNLQDNNADISICNIWRDEDNIITPHQTNYENVCLKLSQNKDNAIKIASRFNPGCPNKMFKRHLLIDNNITQPEGRYYEGEGVVFWLKSVFFSSTICSITDRIYYYRKRHGSVTTKISRHSIEDRFKFIKEIDHCVKNHMITMPGIDKGKVLNDACSYLLRHLDYGERTLRDGDIKDKKCLMKIYQDSIAEFSMQNNWPALPVAYELSISRNHYKNRFEMEVASHKNTKCQLENTANSLVDAHRWKYVYLAGLLASVALNILILSMLVID
jgi:glycosyltransferase involved in cell wall biosynthesis